MNLNKDKKSVEGEEKKDNALVMVSDFLEKVEQKGESGVSSFGELNGFNANIKYGYSIKTAPELGELPPSFRCGFRVRGKRRTRG